MHLRRRAFEAQFAQGPIQFREIQYCECGGATLKAVLSHSRLLKEGVGLTSRHG
jgi:hypothetical protein